MTKLSLAAEFPERSQADWEALATKGLQGAPLSSLAAETLDGIGVGIGQWRLNTDRSGLQDAQRHADHHPIGNFGETCSRNRDPFSNRHRRHGLARANHQVGAQVLA